MPGRLEIPVAQGVAQLVNDRFPGNSGISPDRQTVLGDRQFLDPIHGDIEHLRQGRALVASFRIRIDFLAGVCQDLIDEQIRGIWILAEFNVNGDVFGHSFGRALTVGACQRAAAV